MASFLLLSMIILKSDSREGLKDVLYSDLVAYVYLL